MDNRINQRQVGPRDRSVLRPRMAGIALSERAFRMTLCLLRVGFVVVCALSAGVVIYEFLRTALS